jgi:hypothetical protein
LFTTSALSALTFTFGAPPKVGQVPLAVSSLVFTSSRLLFKAMQKSKKAILEVLSCIEMELADLFYITKVLEFGLKNHRD